MKLTRTDRFKTAYQLLPNNIQKTANKKLKLFIKNPRHPSLRVKKILGTKRIWEASITMDYRFTFGIQKDEYVLRNVGLHDKTLKNP